MTDRRIVFLWDTAFDSPAPGDGPLGYELLVSTDDGRLITGRTRFVQGMHGSGDSYVLRRPLPTNSLIAVQIRAIDASGVSSPWSEPILIRAQDFVVSQHRVVPVELGSAAWVDVDNDGEPDLAMGGRGLDGTVRSRLYLNKEGSLVPNTAFNLPAVVLGGQAWGDTDRDGYLDVLLTGSPSDGSRIANLYMNNSSLTPGHFGDAAFKFRPLSGGRVAMGDVDNDGDVDIVMTGMTSAATFSLQLALNTGGLEGQVVAFDTLSLELRREGEGQGTIDGWISLHDIDQDGDLDITLQGTALDASTYPDYGGILETYRNDGNAQFTAWHRWTGPRSPALSALPLGDPRLDQLDVGEHAWADVDNDGDPDFVAVGYSNVTTEFSVGLDDGGTLRVYENTGGGTLALKQSLSGMWLASLAVADIDNDGAVDILLTGFNDHVANPQLSQGTPSVRLYRNDTKGTFSLAEIDPFDASGSGAGTVRLADIEGDGDLDAVVVGRSVRPGGKTVPLGTVFASTWAVARPNHPPLPPTGLLPGGDSTGATWLQWDEPSDPDGQQHFSYSLRVRTPGGSGDVRSGAEPVGPGTLGYTTEAFLRGVPEGSYYWSVRAVDHGWARSEWSREEIVVIDTTAPTFVGGSLTVAGGIVSASIAFDDRWTSVDHSSDMSVHLDMLGIPALLVETVLWTDEDEWIGGCELDPSQFLTEPASLRVRGVRDIRGNRMPDTTITVDVVFADAQRVAPDKGGEVTSASGAVSLYVKPGAFTHEVGLHLEESGVDSLPTGPDGREPIAAATIVPDDSTETLRTPAILTLDVKSMREPGQAGQLSGLHVYRYTGAEWAYVGGHQGSEAGVVRVPVSKLGLFAVFHVEGAFEGGTLGELTCTPRVFSPGTDKGFSDRTTVSFAVAPEDAGEAEVMVYSRARRLVKRMTIRAAVGENSVVWRGDDMDGRRVRSGAYFVVVKIGGRQEQRAVMVLDKYGGE